MKIHVKTVKMALMAVIRSKGVKKPIGNVTFYRAQIRGVQNRPERMAKLSTFWSKMYRKTCLLVYARAAEWRVFGVLGWLPIWPFGVCACVCVCVCVVCVCDDVQWCDDDVQWWWWCSMMMINDVWCYNFYRIMTFLDPLYPIDWLSL